MHVYICIIFVLLKLKLHYFGYLIIGKDPDADKDWRQEEKRMTKDEMAGWHHWVDGHEFKQALGVGEEQGSLACCSQWGCKELDMTERLNWICIIKCYNITNYIVRFLSVRWSLTPSSCRQTGPSENILCSHLLSSPPHFLLDVSFLHCHGMYAFTLRGPHLLLSLLCIQMYSALAPVLLLLWFP